VSVANKKNLLINHINHHINILLKMFLSVKMKNEKSKV